MLYVRPKPTNAGLKPKSSIGKFEIGVRPDDSCEPICPRFSVFVGRVSNFRSRRKVSAFGATVPVRMEFEKHSLQERDDPGAGAARTGYR
jgi:hypothetical protein